MTSSLVGSEMCIRDSTMRQQGGKLILPPTAGNICEPTPQGFRLTFGRFPVSYTHLTLPTICSV
eukprot:7691684-Prorocentrum_lima.AAC.1